MQFVSALCRQTRQCEKKCPALLGGSEVARVTPHTGEAPVGGEAGGSPPGWWSGGGGNEEGPTMVVPREPMSRGGIAASPTTATTPTTPSTATAPGAAIATATATPPATAPSQAPAATAATAAGAPARPSGARPTTTATTSTGVPQAAANITRVASRKQGTWWSAPRGTMVSVGPRKPIRMPDPAGLNRETSGRGSIGCTRSPRIVRRQVGRRPELGTIWVV